MAKTSDPWAPLSLPEIERKPKKIEKIDGFHIAVPLTERQIGDFATINSLIKTGGDLSPYYRRSHNSTHDKLLAEHKVMHLHLGGPGSDALLYLVQFPEHVLLVCVDTHVHVDDVPPGKKLPMYKISQAKNLLKSQHEARKAAVAQSLKRLVRKKTDD